MKKVYAAVIFASLMLVVSCGSLGGNSGVEIKAGDFDKKFEPKTALAYIDRKLKRPTLSVFLANFDFNPKDRGDLFHPNVSGNPDNVVIRVEIISDEKAEPNDSFKQGETVSVKDNNSQLRFYSMNIYRAENNSTQSVKLKDYKEAKVNITNLTDEEYAGSFDIRFSAIGKDNQVDENAFAKGEFKAKFWKEN